MQVMAGFEFWSPQDCDDTWRKHGSTESRVAGMAPVPLPLEPQGPIPRTFAPVILRFPYPVLECLRAFLPLEEDDCFGGRIHD